MQITAQHGDTTTTVLADRLLEVMVEEDPLNDALDGYPHFTDRLADLDETAEQELRAVAAAIAAEAARLPASTDTAVIIQQAQSVVARLDARLVEHTMSGYDHSPLGRLLGAMPIARPSGDVQEADFLARLAAIPVFLAHAAERHRAGVAAGRVPVADRTAHAVARIERYLAAPPDDPFAAVPLSMAAAERRETVLADTVRPAMAAYRDVLREEIAPHGRPAERPGLCWVTDGELSYAGLARVHTTTDRSADELHRIGLDLVARLDEEYAQLGAQEFGMTGAAAVRAHLRTAPELRWSGAEEILDAARVGIARAEAAAPDWFGIRPEQACTVAPSPDGDGPVAFYVPPALNGSRPGTYFANVAVPAQRCRVTAEALAFHEAVPGHHFQFTIAQNLDGMLPLRRMAWINSYIEGWGLYAERLADEMGLYSGPEARLGMLAMDSLRAARLVVDTGLHAFGWGRQRAVDYLLTNTLLSADEAGAEADRYIEFPGQALSYMVGRLEIERLRTRCAAELGGRFDIRNFHDAVLSGGPLPMAVLDSALATWSSEQLEHAGTTGSKPRSN
jgi:uncharacterized protein (DUF885 family)